VDIIGYFGLIDADEVLIATSATKASAVMLVTTRTITREVVHMKGLYWSVVWQEMVFARNALILRRADGAYIPYGSRILSSVTHIVSYLHGPVSRDHYPATELSSSESFSTNLEWP
jgi:hypothetical protein